MTTAPTPTAERLDLPAPGTWQIDPTHSSVNFSVRHLGLSKVRGQFGSFTGALTVSDEPEQSAVAVSIDVDSIDTREPTRDAHLKSPDFLDAATSPTIAFTSRSVTGAGSQWEVEGDLTIKGLSRPVTLEVTYEGAAGDPWGGSRIAFSASTEIDREDWGMTYNQALEAGGWLVGKKVKVELEVEAIRQDG